MYYSGPRRQTASEETCGEINKQSSNLALTVDKKREVRICKTGDEDHLYWVMPRQARTGLRGSQRSAQYDGVRHTAY